MNLADITIQKQVPITKARRIFSELIEDLPKEHYFVLVKNYEPKAILLYPGLLDDLRQPNTRQLDIDLQSLRQKEEGRFTNMLNQALDKLEKMPKSKLPKLLKE